VPQLDDPDVTIATELKPTGRFAGLQDGESVVFTGQVVIDLIEENAGGGTVTGNAVSAPNDATPGWLVRSFSDDPAGNVLEVRTVATENELLAGVGRSFTGAATGFVSAVNVPKVRVFDGGEQDGTEEPAGMQNGELMYYFEPA
jgi:hypothetical protein